MRTGGRPGESGGGPQEAPLRVRCLSCPRAVAVRRRTQMERGMTGRRVALAVRGGLATAVLALAVAATPGTPGDIGQWGPVVDWPVVGINTALLPNGKVLAYDSVGDGATESFPNQTFTRATVWDPNSGGQTDVRFNGYNIFCSGFAHLMDGSLFIAGGNKDQQLNGLVNTTYFNPDTNQWSAGPDMAAGRWYPTVTALNNGEQ